MIKKILKKILYYPRLFLVNFWYKEYLKTATNPPSIEKLFKLGFSQYILRKNAHVPWPVHKSSFISMPNQIEKGSRCPGLSRGCHIDGRNGIILGRNVWIGPYVSIISKNHALNDFTEYIEDKPVKIGNNCWLGAHSIVLPGVVLGNHVIVAAGSVVTKSFDENNIILAGVPAKIIKRIDEYNK